MKTKHIIIIAAAILVTNLVTYIGVSSVEDNNVIRYEDNQEEAEPDQEPIAVEELALIREIITILEKTHVEEIDRQELLEGAYQGILDELDDPQASYLDPDDYENLMVETEGTYGGIGIEVFNDDGYVTVIAPIAGTPGEEAGLKSGDRILSVNGTDLVDKGLNQAVDMMRGEPGTDLVLEVERPSVDGVLEFEITRAQVELESVEFEMMDNQTGYIKLTSFTETSSQEFSEALTQLEEEGMEKLVLDLRNNPGGLLNAAIEIADMLMPEGPITHVTDGNETVKTYRSETEGLEIPMVAIVNESSVSAAEVLAGALQDSGTATLIGKQTFGKASVQNISELSDGSALRHTVATYQTPDGRTIHEEGLSPDLEIDPPELVKLAKEPISIELSEGDEGEEVETLQGLLKELGFYENEITGYFDNNTTQALENFQAERDIEITGEMSEVVLRQFHEAIEESKEDVDPMLDAALEKLE
ncbi:MAG: S41 family peptidase [Bacillota bacterium]